MPASGSPEPEPGASRHRVGGKRHHGRRPRHRPEGPRHRAVGPYRRRTFEVVTSSVLDAPPDRVWERVSTMPGVNYELWPILRMTYPRWAERLDPGTVPLGRRIFRSWILLFGIVPCEYDDVRLERLDPGNGFLERSTMLGQRLWEHERTLEDPAGAPGTCRLTDRVRFIPRLPAGGRVALAIVRRLFRHRHRRLRKAFGGKPGWEDGE